MIIISFIISKRLKLTLSDLKYHFAKLNNKLNLEA